MLLETDNYMGSISKGFRNIICKFKGIKEVSDSNDAIHFKCLKCGGDLIAHKGYGKLRLLCKGGHAANVYTGKDIHFMSDTKKAEVHSTITKDEKEKIDEQRRVEVFYKHISSDLTYLCTIVTNKRDITRQVRYEECFELLNGVDGIEKEGYEEITKYLKKFCDLDPVPLNIVWEPLYNQNELSSIEKKMNVIGTTYLLPLKSLLFYTIYLNPKFILSSRILIATIAHELSHIYANHNNIQFTSPDNERGDKAYSEQMTDLLGIVLGMGELMCTPSDRNESFDTGYLTNDMICKSYNLWESEYLSGKNKDIKTLVICGRCSQKLKVPISKKKVLLICPKCKTKFKYKSF